MYQRRFWGNRRFRKGIKIRRPRKIELSERGIFEPVQLEEDVVQEIMHRLWYSGVPVFREKERIPRCPHCGKYVTSARGATERGHPDLHGYVPAHLMPTKQAMPFMIECKRPDGGVASIEQQAIISQAKQHGVVALFARSWSEVRCEFERLGVLLKAAA